MINAMHSIHILLFLLLVHIAAAQPGHAASNSHGHSVTKRAAFGPGADGVCHTYTIQSGETCAILAKRYQITTANIETWNAGAWAFSGCANVRQGDFVCLSSGALPMPVALPHATCGPQVPGTRHPASYSDLASLNPCPSDQCCGAMGECGTTSDFCDTSKRCISNCGVKSAAKESTTKKATSMATLKTTVAKSTSKTTVATTTSKSTVSKTTAARTSTTQTKSKTTTTTKSTTTQKPMVTMTSIKVIWQSKTTSSFNPEASWQITIYKDKKCKGDYFSVQGHESSKAGNCLVFQDNKQTEISDTKTSCRWWTDGGLHWDTCSSSKLVAPKSWFITKGQCLFYKGKECKDEDYLGQTYTPAQKCQSEDTGAMSPQLKGDQKTNAHDWGSMRCFYAIPFDTSGN
ncbi:Peptidoglycan-binding Lysin subgroup [Penicillium concentricum]|uniref:Peptidoglycan-binding Lysin subgroup n=1 Tax=Penicillium concentricum TaxID=293559 RepID=A0A9W9SQX0_9EURO|nr:Peptidoglycan-binding Lysin subgroup [Penicillium concentricum]KAJ5383026.1 Peptidoglycan-binding Lysin subgroup [Penicillium concentricum]